MAAAPEWLDNQVHPMFELSKWITELPMHEVEAQLLPAFRLATKILTNDKALEWFAHVRFVTPVKHVSGMRQLIREAEPVTQAMLDVIKAQILDLADKTQFTRIAGKQEGLKKGVSSAGETCHTIVRATMVLNGTNEFKLLRLIGQTLPFMATTFINVRFFYVEMRQKYQGGTRAAQHVFQLHFARLLVHEFAHAWLGFCHPWTMSSMEPLILPPLILPPTRYLKLAGSGRISCSAQCLAPRLVRRTSRLSQRDLSLASSTNLAMSYILMFRRYGLSSGL